MSEIRSAPDPDTVRNATRVEATTVERRDVGSDKLSVADPGVQGWPEFAEGGCVADVFPAEAMTPVNTNRAPGDGSGTTAWAPGRKAVKLYGRVAKHVFQTNIEDGVSLLTKRQGNDFITRCVKEIA